LKLCPAKRKNEREKKRWTLAGFIDSSVSITSKFKPMEISH
jgi:hypothetical protein